MWGPLWKNKTINLTIIFNPYYYRKKLALLLLLSLLTLLHLYVLQNTKITMLTLEGFAGKICSTAGPLFEELEGKN